MNGLQLFRLADGSPAAISPSRAENPGPTASHTVEPGGGRSAAPPRGRRKALVTIVVVVALLLALFLPTVLASWAPVIRIECVATEVVANQTGWLPLAIANSPYEGNTSEKSIVPKGLYGPPPDNPPGVVGSVNNGTIGGGLWQVNFTVFALSNSLTWGFGSNRRCSQSFEIQIESVVPGRLFTGDFFEWAWGPQFGPNATSDAGEPTQFNLSLVEGQSTVYFDNGFYQPNTPSISTCGTGDQHRSAISNYLDVWTPFVYKGHLVTQRVVLPFTQEFQYSFPANSGTWQIDNLSAPSGPGGGWAFSYSPCS